MSTTIRSRLGILAALLLAGAIGSTFGCASPQKYDGGAAGVSTESAANGAELWAATCARCHNLRSPSSYSAGQWEVIVHHMRVRCTITGQDERAIVAFLKAGAGAGESKE
jgi:hypothetical protein